MSQLDTIKRSLIMFFLGLPLIITIVTFFLGFGLGNAGLLWLSGGQMVFVPVAVTVIHFVTGTLAKAFIGLKPYIEIFHSDIGQLVPSATLTGSTTEINVMPSYWMAHFAFFSSYIVCNAAAIYKLEAVSDTPEYMAKVGARKSRALNIIIFTAMFFLVLSGIRLAFTKSETIPGALVATGVFGLLGWGWYTASNTLGIRTMDIFGVAQQMVVTHDPSKPVTCINT